MSVGREEPHDDGQTLQVIDGLGSVAIILQVILSGALPTLLVSADLLNTLVLLLFSSRYLRWLSEWDRVIDIEG